MPVYILPHAFVLCRLLGCPRANVGQTVKQSDCKSSTGFMSRSTKTKNGKNLTSGFNLREGRQLVRRVTRQNGGGPVEDRTISVNKKGTAAALMGGKRAGTASSNEATTTVITQFTKQIAAVKPVRKSGSFQRKVPKAQRSPEDTVTDTKAEGGAVKRRRIIEDSAEEAGIESEDAMKSETVASVIEEEVVEPLELSIDVDEPPPLDEEKKRRIEETQQLLKLISVDSVVAPPVISPSARSFSTRRVSLTQQAEIRRDAETRELAVTQSRAVSEDKETTKEITNKDKNREVEWRSNSGKDSDSAVRLPVKFEEYFPSVDAGSEVFSDGKDMENLLRIEQRCAVDQSSIARSSHEEIEVEPNVEQMEVEEEVTVEGGGILLVESCASLNSEGIDEKTSCENNKSFQTSEITVTESTTTAVSAPGLCSVLEEETASNKQSAEDSGALSLQPAVQSLTAAGENLTAQQSSNIVSDEVYQISEKSVGLTDKGSPGNFKVSSSSSKVPGSCRDLKDVEHRAVFIENKCKENIPLVLATETIPAVDTSDSDNEKTSSATGSSSDADVSHAVGQNTRASVEVGTGPCSLSPGTKTSDITKTKSSIVPDSVKLDEECSRTVKSTPADSQISAQYGATLVAVSQTDDSSSALAAGQEDADTKVMTETAEICTDNLPGTSLLVEREPENADATVKPLSYEVQCNSADTNPETDASNDEVAEAGNMLKEGSSEKVAMSCAVSVQSGPAPGLATCITCGPAVSVVAARTFTSAVAGSGGPAVTSVVAAGAVPGFVGMPPVAIRATMPGSTVGSVFVHVADPRQFAMHLQQQGQVPAQAQTPVFHIPTLSPQQGGGPPQLVMSPLSPQQVALLSSSIPPTTQPPHPLVGGVPPRHVTLVTPGPRPQLLQQCLLTSAGPQPLALLPAAQPASTSTTTSGASSTAVAQPSVPIQHLAILSHALQGSGVTVTSTTAPTSGHQQPVALIAAAGPNQTPVMRMAPAVLPRHPMSASSAMQHLTSAVQQTISLQQLQLSFAAAAAAAQQQQQLASSAIRSPIPIQRLPVLCTAQPSHTSATMVPSTTTPLAVVSVAAAPVVSMPVSPMVSVAASALTAFLKKENMASQLLPPPAMTIAKLSPHDVALKGGCSLLHLSSYRNKVVTFEINSNNFAVARTDTHTIEFGTLIHPSIIYYAEAAKNNNKST